MTHQTKLSPPYIQVILSIIWPILLGFVVALVVGNFVEVVDLPARRLDLFLGGLGLGAFLVGRRPYGAKGLGLRGGRPFFAGAGFAFLAWLAALLARFLSIGIGELGSGLGRVFLALLLFEAIAVQIWCFGLLFRALADWRNPISATIVTGVLFGAIAHIAFRESLQLRYGLFYFIAWGLLYALIRLRTGSWIGIALIQALQTLTVWFLVAPAEPISMAYFYLIAGGLYLLIGWRLWPQYETDLRV